MLVRYRCPICGRVVGQFSMSDFEETRLGLDILTSAEKADIIDVVDTDLIEIKTRCEVCLPDFGVEYSEQRFTYMWH